LAKRTTVDKTPESRGASNELVGWSTLGLGMTISLLLLWRNGGWAAFRSPSPFRGFDDYNLFNIALLLLPPLTWILLFLKREVSEFGLTPGNTKGALLFTAITIGVFTPICFLFFSKLHEVQAYYVPVFNASGVLYNLEWRGGNLVGGQIDYGRVLYHETVMGMYMFSWEWFFRGFLLFGLRKIMPTWAAAIVQMIPFVILHLGKPAGEFWSSIAGGLILVPVAVRYKSFVPCFLGHYALSVINDLAVLYHHFQ